MFLGHYAVALAAKPIAPKASLGTLFAAGAFLDLVWPVLVLAGIERVFIEPGNTAFTPLNFQHYPYSHSLLMSTLWALLFGAGYFLLNRCLYTAVVVAGLVLSHWLLDAIVHRPDLPLTLSETTMIGFGLWNSIIGTLILELVLFAAGTVLYMRSTITSDRIGSIGFIGFGVFLLLIFAGASLGPLPPNSDAVAWSGMAQWLIVLLAAWIDRHRVARSSPAG